jgi:hypothetical protein
VAAGIDKKRWPDMKMLLLTVLITTIEVAANWPTLVRSSRRRRFSWLLHLPLDEGFLRYSARSRRNLSW